MYSSVCKQCGHIGEVSWQNQSVTTMTRHILYELVEFSILSSSLIPVNELSYRASHICIEVSFSSAYAICSSKFSMSSIKTSRYFIDSLDRNSESPAEVVVELLFCNQLPPVCCHFYVISIQLVLASLRYHCKWCSTKGDLLYCWSLMDSSRCGT